MKRRLLITLPVVAVLLVVVVAAVYVLNMRQPTLASTASSCTSSSAAEIDITLSDTKITSSIAMLSPSICYHFVIKNTGTSNFDLLVRPPALRGQTGRDGTDPVARIINIAPGQSQTLDFNFGNLDTGTPMEYASFVSGQDTLTAAYEITLAH